jgi:hypothetical protein
MEHEKPSPIREDLDRLNMKHNPSLQPLEGNAWRSTDSDPWFLVEGPFAPGEYWLDFQAKLVSDTPSSNMKLYVGDENRVFSEANCVVLGRMPRGAEKSKVRMRLRIHSTVSAFRFDPCEAVAEFELTPLTLTLRKAWLTDFHPEVEAAPADHPQARVNRLLERIGRTAVNWALDWRKINEVDVNRALVERDHAHDDMPTLPKVELKEGQQPHIRPFDLPWIVPLNVDVRTDMPQRLNVMIPGIAMRYMSGGPNTVINLTYRLAREGVPVRYVSTDVPEESDHGLLYAHFKKLTGVSKLDNVEIVSASDRSRPLPIGDRDVFFGSSWWTVQLIQRILPRMRAKRFLYMIQDYESGFLPWSSAHACAEETYGFDYRAVICGQLLADHMVASRTGQFADPSFIDKCATFEPAVDSTRFRFERTAHPPDRKRLLFYARPGAPRNLYEMGLYALREAVQAGCFRGPEWELWGMGEPIPATELADSTSLKPWPWSNYDDYAKLLRSADVGLSLMQSPHSSYPPLELAACGAQVVTNCFGVKTAPRLLDYSTNIVPVKTTVDDIVRGLKEAESRISNWDLRERGSHLKLASDWDDVFEPMLPRVLGMWDECRKMATGNLRTAPGIAEPLSRAA